MMGRQFRPRPAGQRRWWRAGGAAATTTSRAKRVISREPVRAGSFAGASHASPSAALLNASRTCTKYSARGGSFPASRTRASTASAALWMRRQKRCAAAGSSLFLGAISMKCSAASGSDWAIPSRRRSSTSCPFKSLPASASASAFSRAFFSSSAFSVGTGGGDGVVLMVGTAAPSSHDTLGVRHVGLKPGGWFFLAHSS
mmetsp:Transcript_6461/g.20307  ORF Transcript_6461/g.20307 Transcript_6461/m.20307 type:complete len:200 (-) Transcript_6461:734-1333(-)